jgi:NADH-ubiquinone oxidoreductase chain 4
MLFLIGFFGSRNRKVYAAYQFFLYTLIGSLFLLLALIVLYLEAGTSDYLTL